MFARIVLIVMCLVVGALRISLPSHGLNSQDIFKDIAHLFVGGLFGAAIALKKDWLLWILFLSLTVLELLAATLK